MTHATSAAPVAIAAPVVVTFIASSGPWSGQHRGQVGADERGERNDAAEDGADGGNELAHGNDLRWVILPLDVMMPGQSGLDVLATLRRTRNVPVVIVTAKEDETDRVVGLRLGADDYVDKPFSNAELLTRLASVLRRTGAYAAPARLEFPGLKLDLSTREVTVGRRRVEVPAREFDLLAFLASSPRETFSRQELPRRRTADVVIMADRGSRGRPQGGRQEPRHEVVGPTRRR